MSTGNTLPDRSRSGGRSYPATGRDEPLFDPDNEKMTR